MGNLRVVTLVVETLVWDMFGYTYLWVLHPVAKLWRLGDVILFTATVCAQPVPSNFKGGTKVIITYIPILYPI